MRTTILPVLIAGFVALSHCAPTGAHKQADIRGPGVDTDFPTGLKLIYPAHEVRVNETAKLGANGTILAYRGWPSMQTNLSFALVTPDGIDGPSVTTWGERLQCKGKDAKPDYWWLLATVSQEGR
jgi:hypothetical protein